MMMKIRESIHPVLDDMGVYLHELDEEISG